MTDILKQPHRPAIFVEVHPEGIDRDPRYTERIERLLTAGYHCRYAISPFHPTAMGQYRKLGYRPTTVAKNGQAIFEDIQAEHVLGVAAGRPKITRALLPRVPALPAGTAVDEGRS